MNIIYNLLKRRQGYRNIGSHKESREAEVKSMADEAVEAKSNKISSKQLNHDTTDLQDKLDVIHAGYWFGGCSDYDNDKDTSEVEKYYKDWTEDISTMSPKEVKEFFIEMLINPNPNYHFWNDHIGLLVRAVYKGERAPIPRSPYIKHISDVFHANLSDLMKFTKWHIRHLGRPMMKTTDWLNYGLSEKESRSCLSRLATDQLYSYNLSCRNTTDQSSCDLSRKAT